MPASRPSSSSSVSSPALCSTRAWAREPARSYGASRQSKWVDRDSASSSGLGPPANRPPHSLPVFVVLSVICSPCQDSHVVGRSPGPS